MITAARIACSVAAVAGSLAGRVCRPSGGTEGAGAAKCTATKMAGSTRQDQLTKQPNQSVHMRPSSAYLLAAILGAVMPFAGAMAQGVVDLDQRPEQAIPSTATAIPSSIARTYDAPAADQEKYITYLPQGIGPWSPKVVHWRYNDAGRNAAIVGAATAAEALATIQAAQAKWSAVCNIQFVYDGTSSATPTPNSMSSGHDGVSVIGWSTTMAAPQTGVAGVYASGSSLPLPIVESDMLLNATFNPNLASTALHEVGHMIGIDHSDVQNAVMSGPPLTSYVSLTTLQADDIAGCVSLYGAAATPTISGTITNGAAAVAGVTFCAQPSAGVSCTASNASGAYSCTVPSGWTGRLHSPMVGSNRIPAQSFANVTSAVTRNVSASSGVPGCNLDVDNNGLFDAATDGVAIMRRMLGFGQSAFAGLAGTCAANTTASAIYAATNASYNAAGYNATGGSATLPATDGAVILRAMLGLTGSAVTNGLGLASEGGASRTSWTNIQSWLNTTCGANF